MKAAILFFVFSMFLISCKSTKFDQNIEVSESETVIVGKFKILNKDKDITKNSKIYFDENKKGVLSYKLDETGFLVLKLPKGNHFIKLIYTPYGSVNLPLGYANISVPEHSNVYNIGTIEIQTDGNLAKKFQGAIYDTSPRWAMERKLDIKVESNSEEVNNFYQSKFGNKTKLTESLLTIVE